MPSGRDLQTSQGQRYSDDDASCSAEGHEHDALDSQENTFLETKYVDAGITPGVCALASLARLSSASSTGRTEAWLQALGW